MNIRERYAERKEGPSKGRPTVLAGAGPFEVSAAEAARALAHAFDCDQAGQEIEFRCADCVKARAVLARLERAAKAGGADHGGNLGEIFYLVRAAAGRACPGMTECAQAAADLRQVRNPDEAVPAAPRYATCDGCRARALLAGLRAATPPASPSGPKRRGSGRAEV